MNRKHYVPQEIADLLISFAYRNFFQNKSGNDYQSGADSVTFKTLNPFLISPTCGPHCPTNYFGYLYPLFSAIFMFSPILEAVPHISPRLFLF